MTAATGAGIASYGAYIPMTRLPLAADLRARRRRRAAPRRRSPTTTRTASRWPSPPRSTACAASTARGVDGVYFASTTYPLREKQGATPDRQGARPAPRRADRRLRAARCAPAPRRCARRSDAVAGGLGAQGARDRERLPHGRAARRRSRRSSATARWRSWSAIATPIARSRPRTRVADELQDVWRIEGERVHAQLGGPLRRRRRATRRS